MGLRTQQMRTIKLMNMHICSGEDCIDNTWPTLERANNIPKGLVTFEVASSNMHPDKYAHFFIDDYRFERLWQRPEEYVPILKRYAGVIMPDFSTYVDMPYPMQAWNKYRAMALAHYWQQEGIDVIPNIMTGDEYANEWMYDGLQTESVLCTSSVGMYRDKRLRERFKQDIEDAVKRLRPKALVMYGKRIPFDSCGAKVYWYKNDNHQRVVANLTDKE